MEPTYTAFVGPRHVATGTLDHVRDASRPWADNATGPLLLFRLEDGQQVDLDWHAEAASAEKKAGPGRPKLGVVSAEVTLLPRHWAFLATQPAGASGTLRRLVEDAMVRAANDPAYRLRALGKVLGALAGNEAGYEEAMRALYAGDREGLDREAARWPGDLPAFVRSWS